MKSKLPNYFSQSFLLTVLGINLSLFFYIAGYVKNSQINFQDVAISLYVQSFQTDYMTFLMKFISFFGYPLPASLAVIFVCWYLYKQNKIKFSLLFSIVLFADAIGSFIKWLIDRPRPTGEYLQIMSQLDSRSFPSNHAIHYTVFFGLFIYFLERGVIKASPATSVFLRIFSVILVLMVGISRIYLGAHWLTDVIGGYLLGSFFLISAILIAQKLKIKA